MSYNTIHSECHESLNVLLIQHENLDEKTYDGERSFLDKVETWIAQMREYINDAEAMQIMQEKMEARKKNLGINLNPVMPKPEPPSTPPAPQPTQPAPPEQNPNQPEPAKPETPKPVKPAENKPSIEDYLPPEIRNPNLAMRLKIFRLNTGMTVKQIAQRTGLNKTDIYGIENGQLKADFRILEKLAAVYKTTADMLHRKPISDLLSFNPDQDIPTRIKTARIRAGLSIEQLAQNAAQSKYAIEQYECKAPDDKTIDKLAQVLNIPSWIIKTAIIPSETTSQTPHKPSTPSFTSYSESIGEKLHRIRNEKYIPVSELAAAAECSTSHIYSIERGKTIPSDDMLQKLAAALGVNTYELEGNDLRQPETVFKDLTAKKRSVQQASQASTHTANNSQNALSLTTEISKARMQRQLTVQDIARQLGCSVTAFSELESIGLTRTNGPLLKKVAKFLDINLNNYGIKI